MSQLRPPSLVVFDLDDTLYPYEPCDRAGRQALFQFASVELGIAGTAFSDAFTQARENVKARLGATAASHSRLLYCHEALELVGLRSEPQVALIMEQEYWRTYLTTMRLRPGVTELLQSLRYHSIATAVVTDLTAQIQFRKLCHLDLARLIDHVVCSEETREEKRSLAPFRLLASRVAEPVLEHVWFIGDGDHDAPVAELVAEGVVADGRAFVLGGTQQPGGTGWTDLLSIESELTLAVDTAR